MSSLRIKQPSRPKKPVHVCIAFPAYTGQVHVYTMRSVIADIMALAQRGYKVSIADECGNAIIGDCRAKILAGVYRNPDFTHLIMVDHDVSWNAGSMVRLIEHDVDLVCGMYPRRSDPLTFNFRSQMENGEGLDLDPQKQLLEVWGVPMGFICLSRDCIEKMIHAYPESEFDVEEGVWSDGKTKPRTTAWALFDPYRVDGSRTKLGEDYAFCQRWRDIGGKVYIDPFIAMGHTGNKTFVGELGQWFETTDEAAPEGEAVEQGEAA